MNPQPYAVPSDEVMRIFQTNRAVREIAERLRVVGATASNFEALGILAGVHEQLVRAEMALRHAERLALRETITASAD